jgi:hypothetical protein
MVNDKNHPASRQAIRCQVLQIGGKRQAVRYSCRYFSKRTAFVINFQEADQTTSSVSDARGFAMVASMSGACALPSPVPKAPRPVCRWHFVAMSAFSMCGQGLVLARFG